MFYPNEFLDIAKSSDIGENKFKKRMRKCLKSQDFYGWLFNPAKGQIADYNGLVTSIFGGICENPRKLEWLADVIDENKGEFTRSTSAFLCSVVSYGQDVANSVLKSAEAEYTTKNISRAEYEKSEKDVSKYCEILNRIDDSASKIVKREAKELAVLCNMPKAICKIALKKVPDPIYIPGPKAGTHLDNILQAIYYVINNKDCDVSDIKWKKFFDQVFGQENRNEIAAYLLLESPTHITDLTSKSVRAVWDSLTAFALTTLEKGGNGDRTHAIEIYLKRLASDFSNGNYNMRVDLRSLSEKDYPELTKTVLRYSDKFNSVLKPIAETLMN